MMRTPEPSHYVPVFTTRQADGTQRAVCGAFVHGFSTEPTCPSCQRWLHADAEMLDSLMRWSKSRDDEQAAAREPRR